MAQKMKAFTDGDDDKHLDNLNRILMIKYGYKLIQVDSDKKLSFSQTFRPETYGEFAFIVEKHFKLIQE